MATLEDVLTFIPNDILVVIGVLVLGIVLGFFVAKLNRRILIRAGVPEAVEGTAFERTVRNFGSSTVSILASLSMWFIIGLSVLAAVTVANVRYTDAFWASVTSFLPKLFVAILVLIIGILIGDKVEVVISERLKGIKLPQVDIIPRLAKYSIIYVASLIALGQIGVAIEALLVLLTVYIFALVFFSGLAFKDLLRSGAAGIYLLLNQPYAIGDKIELGPNTGIVQEITIFVTRIENDDIEYVVPNRLLFEDGLIRYRSE